MEEYGIDYLAFSGHKVYAPFGSGALVARRGLLSFGQDDLLNEEAICRRVIEMPNQAILSQAESLRRSLYTARRM